MAVRLLPSTEKLAVELLKASADVVAAAPGGIGTVLYGGSQPRLWLTEVSGTERVRRHLSVVSVDVRSYGGSKEEADLLRMTAHDVLVNAESEALTAGVLNSVRCIALPTWNPDDSFEPPWPRYVGTYELVSHPALP